MNPVSIRKFLRTMSCLFAVSTDPLTHSWKIISVWKLLHNCSDSLGCQHDVIWNRHRNNPLGMSVKDCLYLVNCSGKSHP